MEQKTYIYELSKNGIPFYIGKTVKPKIREVEHKRDKGQNIVFTIIDEINSVKKEDWKPLEHFWIIQYQAFGFELKNKNTGGGGPKTFITPAIKKMIDNTYNKTEQHKLSQKAYYERNKENLKKNIAMYNRNRINKLKEREAHID